MQWQTNIWLWRWRIFFFFWKPNKVNFSTSFRHEFATKLIIWLWCHCKCIQWILHDTVCKQRFFLFGRFSYFLIHFGLHSLPFTVSFAYLFISFSIFRWQWHRRFSTNVWQFKCSKSFIQSEEKTEQNHATILDKLYDYFFLILLMLSSAKHL